ncbi:MAG TPA: YceI family protein [Thermoanaerobaculia bacterium]|nr:YceI family protein [Thermoanaerobaculia bacterium]
MKTIYCFSLVLLIGLAACQTDIDEKPAAEIVSGGSTAATSTATGEERVVPIDKSRSQIGFVGAKVTGQHEGTFHEFDGGVRFRGEEATGVDFTIGVASLETDSQRLDNHLRSADFFDVANHPNARFTSNSIQPVTSPSAEGHTHEVTGNLEMRGTSQEIRFPVSVAETTDGLGVVSQFTIDRHDWGVSFKGAPDDLIRDDVLIRLDIFVPNDPAAVTSDTPTNVNPG